MGYTKIITYSDVVEIYEYEKSPTGGKKKKRVVEEFSGNEGVSVCGEEIYQLWITYLTFRGNILVARLTRRKLCFSFLLTK